MKETLEQRVAKLEIEVQYLIALMEGFHNKTGLFLEYARPSSPKVNNE